MDYPIVYDRFETTFAGLGLAILENSKNVKIKEVINGEYTLSLILPRNDPKWQYIQPEGFIVVEGQKFRIRVYEEQRDNQGRLLSNVQCEHVSYDANDCKFIPKFEMVGKTPREIIQAAFAGTRFAIGTVEIDTLTDIFLSKTTPMKVLQKLIENVGGELLRDNWTIHLKKRRGNNNGVQFRIGKNITSIKKTTDTRGLITRLYAYGKDDLDITSVNNGVAYLDSPYIGNYDRIHADGKDYKDIEEPEKLKTKAQGEFSTSEVDGIDKPKVTYYTEIVELKKLAEYGRFETFGLGDTVKIIDEDLNVDVNAKIMEYEYYPYEPQRSTVVLANFRDNIGRLFAELVQGKQHLDGITDNKGNIRADWLENIKNQVITDIEEGLSKKVVVHDYGDIWVDNIDNPTKAMAIVNGMFAIANSKKENGDWAWKVLGTGDRLIADEVDTKWIYAGKVTASQLEVIPDDKIMSSSTWNNKVDPSYPKFTHIDPTGIYTGTLTAQQINAIQGISLGQGANINWNYVNKPGYTASEVGARPYNWMPSAGEVGAIPNTYIDANGVFTPAVYATNINTLYGKITTAQIENLVVGSNVAMGPNASISWNNVTNQPYIPSQYTDSQALDAWVASGYKTYIDSNGVYTGTVNANQVNTVGLAAERIYQPGYPSNYGAIGGVYGDLALYYNGLEYYRIYNDNQVMTQRYKGVGYMYTDGHNTYPLHTWDFSQATVTGINVTAKFA